MSNEHKDWLWNKIQEIVLDRGLVDRTLNTSDTRFVDGIRNGQRVRYEVWFDDELCEWRVEHRETNN